MNYEKYENKMPYPERLAKPFLKRNASALEARRFAEDMEEYETKKDTWLKEHEKYRAEINRLYNLFKKDALEETGLSNHPNKDAIFNYAWQEGHSSGYHEVFNTLSNLAELFLVKES